MNDAAFNDLVGAALDAVQGALDRSRGNREALSGQLNVLDAEFAEHAHELDTIVATLGKLTSGGDGLMDDSAVGTLFDPLDETVDALQASIGDAVDAIAPCTSMIDDLAGSCAVLQQGAESGLEAVRGQWDDALQAFAQTCTGINDAIGEAEVRISEWRMARLEELKEAVDDVGAAIHEAIDGIDAAADAAIDSMATAYSAQVREQVGAATGDVLETIEHVLGQTKDGFRDISDKLTSVTETLGTVVEIVEPVLPVLDAAANLA
jgi:ABC-type transporter Mla subunit MlaD